MYLNTINNMANVYDDKGDYDKALEMYEKCLEGRMKALGEAHPSTLSTIDNMANVYYNKGDYDKALEMYEKCLEGRMKALGEIGRASCRERV